MTAIFIGLKGGHTSENSDSHDTIAQLPTHNLEEFLRTVGLSQEDFRYLNEMLADYLAKQRVLNPLTRRGRKDSKPILEDRLLLTLYYLRHYPTLINQGGGRFSASASRIVMRLMLVLQGS